MTLRLVTEARPIPSDRRTLFEQEKIEEAQRWISAVADDAKRKKPSADQIDEHKSGRVLFIDGPRGAGKTSFLLTFLQDLDRRRPLVRVLRPILDFDPLPRGMPIHGWLLEPWRKESVQLEMDRPSHSADGHDLSELWNEVYENAVLGWSDAEGKGVLEKALAYQEKSSGWVDMRTRWFDLVNASVCRVHGCHSKDCSTSHPVVYVIAIDDVDLQVEQLPHLLHAIRLLHHPNVAYILTGDIRHLRFVLRLDYIRRHSRYLQNIVGSPREVQFQNITEQMDAYSRTLCDALLEKALPSHAILPLSTLNLESLLNMHIEGASSKPRVADRLKPEWRELAQVTTELGIVTARRAQHAIDKHLSSSPGEDRADNYLIDLFGSLGDDNGHTPLTGRLTTTPGPVFLAWEGEQLVLQLRRQPIFALQSDFNEPEPQYRSGADANRAAVLQLAVEKGLITAPNLDWRPDAGVVATVVKLNRTEAPDDAVFHWPWLLRPTVSEVLQFADVAKELSDCAGDASDLRNLNGKMVLAWLRRNVVWCYSREGLPPPSMDSFHELSTVIGKLLRKPPLKKVTTDEIKRWVNQILLMTAPYYGLPEDVGTELRSSFEQSKIVGERAQLISDEERCVEDAILTQTHIYSTRYAPGYYNYENAAERFLKTRKAIAPEHPWWAWLARRKTTRQKSKTKTR